MSIRLMDLDIESDGSRSSMVAGYARVQTNLEGKIFNIEEMRSTDIESESYLFDFKDEILEGQLEEKDCDLLVTLQVVSDNTTTWEGIEYDSYVEFPNVVVLQRNYKKILENKIEEYDKIVYESGELIRRLYTKLSKTESMYMWNGLPDDAATLLELHDTYLEAYGEEIELKSYPREEEETDVKQR